MALKVRSLKPSLKTANLVANGMSVDLEPRILLLMHQQLSNLSVKKKKVNVSGFLDLGRGKSACSAHVCFLYWMTQRGQKAHKNRIKNKKK